MIYRFPYSLFLPFSTRLPKTSLILRMSCTGSVKTGLQLFLSDKRNCIFPLCGTSCLQNEFFGKDAVAFWFSDLSAEHYEMHHNHMIGNYGAAVWSWTCDVNEIFPLAIRFYYRHLQSQACCKRVRQKAQCPELIMVVNTLEIMIRTSIKRPVFIRGLPCFIFKHPAEVLGMPEP